VMSGLNATTNQYMGVIEAQDTAEINADSSRTIKSLLVAEGDEVSAGQTLFTYDTTDLEQEIEGYKLDLERYQAQIDAYNKQISDIETQRDKAIEKKTIKESELLEYTTQIQSIQLSIQEVENEITTTNLSIEKNQTKIANSYVTATISGTVKEINDPESSVSDAYSGSSSAFIVIEADGDYRVKGTINEQNVWMIEQGQAVIIRSRVNDDTWTGSISNVDTENQANTSNSENYYGGSTSNSSTDYPFYIELDNAEGLLLGQHVYIEMDYGQGEAKEGIWLGSAYVVTGDDGSAYVWTRDEKEKLEKRKVEVGEYDADMDLYEILSGLTMTDYIAASMDSLYEGITCVTDASEVDYSSPLYTGGDEYDTDESYDEMYDETYDESYDETYDESYDETYDETYDEDYDESCDGSEDAEDGSDLSVSYEEETAGGGV